jgi:SPOR domain
VVLGNMGTFYAVHVGPVASAAAGEGLCKKLKGSGVDCFLAAP